MSLKVPSGLPEEIFPLQFVMEDTQLCLSPNAARESDQGSIPVSPGPSMITSGKQAFQFTRTLTWTQYNAITASGNTKTIPTYFKTSKAVENIKVYVYHELFGTKSN